MSEFQGTRIMVDSGLYPYEIEVILRAGDYCYCERLRLWILRAPNGDYCVVRPPTFGVEEHEDGTITVGPASILFYKKDGGVGWHGYLRKGVWIQ